MASVSELAEFRFQDLIDDGVLQIGDGYRAKNRELGGLGLIFLRAGQVTDSCIEFHGVERFHAELTPSLQSKTAMTGDTIITTKGNSTGRTAFVTEDMPVFVYSPHLSFWRSLDESKLDKRFLRYWSIGQEFAGQLDSLKGQTDMAPYLSLRDQKRLWISLPKIETQRAIGRILGALDDKIELNREMNGTLEAMARALFKSWFVDFDPVTARAAGRVPAHMAPSTADLFPKTFTDSELGPIPEGWEVNELSRLADVVMGTSPPGSSYNDQGIGVPLINGPAQYGDFFPKTDKWTTMPTRLSAEGDLIFCVRGSTTGRRVIADGIYCLGRGVCSIRSADNQGFVDLAIDYALDEMLTFATGSTFPCLNAPTIKSYKFLSPDHNLLAAFRNIVNPLRSRIFNNVMESSDLAVTRDALLPELLSGRIRLRDAERIIEEVA